jgi:flagellar hook-length control protein FliK
MRPASAQALVNDSDSPARKPNAPEQPLQASDQDVDRIRRLFNAPRPTDGNERSLPPETGTTQAADTLRRAVGDTAPARVPDIAPASLGAAQVSRQPPTEAGQALARVLPAIDVPVQDTVWGERVGERVVIMAGTRLQNAEIRLTPAEMGPVRVQVTVEDGAANVSFLAQHAVTREALEQAIPRLREMLAENGIQLGQTSVSGEGVAQGDQDGSAAEPDPTQSAMNTSLVDTFV